MQLENLHDAIEGINTDLNHISTWNKHYGLKLNTTKMQVIFMGSSRMVSKILVDWFRLPQVIKDGTYFKISDNVKNLGVVFDRQLSWAPQIAGTSRKLFRKLLLDGCVISCRLPRKLRLYNFFFLPFSIMLMPAIWI